VTLVVHMKAMLDGMILEVGDESGDVDDGQCSRPLKRAAQRGDDLLEQLLGGLEYLL
jgi:hypothetical protein